MCNGTTVIKPSYDILYKNIISKAGGGTLLTFDLFISALESLSEKLDLFPEEINEADRMLKLVNKLLAAIQQQH